MNAISRNTYPRNKEISEWMTTERDRGKGRTTRRTIEADRPDIKTRPTRQTEEAKEYTRTRKMTLDVKRYIF